MKHGTRLCSLDGLRGIAALAVVMFHSDIFFLPQAGLSRLVPGLGRAYLAVDLFFLMSGFVLAHVYGLTLASNWRAHWLEYAKARFARIYPLIALTTLVMVAEVTISGAPLRRVSFSEGSLALQPLLLQSWASGLNWNYPSWSLSTEAASYLALIFSARVLLRGRYPASIAVGCFAILVALDIEQGGSLNYFNGVPALLRTFSEIALGVLLYRMHSRDATFPRHWLAILATALIGIGVLLRRDCLAVAGLGCLLSYCTGATAVVGRVLNSPPAVTLGDWSYSIYLWHVPVQYGVIAVFAARAFPISDLNASSARLLLAATTLAVIGLSAGSYEYFEVPMRRLLRRRVFPQTLEARYPVR